MKYKEEIKSFKEREIIHFKTSLEDKYVLFAMFTIGHKYQDKLVKKIYEKT